MKYIAFIGIISGSLFGCSAKQRVVAPRPENKLVLPGYRPGSDEIFLTDGAAEKFYGSMLVWNDGASPENIEAISVLSDETKELEAMAADFYKDHGPSLLMIADLTTQRANVALEGQNDLTRRRAQGDLQQRPQLVENSNGWLQTTVDGFVQGGILTQLDADEAMKRFASYCEAKLFEMATSPYLMSFNYIDRPTPNPICERVYAQKGLLVTDTAECKSPAQAGETKDFFQCFWLQGVFKTDYWMKKYSDPTQAAMVQALIEGTIDGGWKDAVLAGTAVDDLLGKFTYKGQVLKPDNNVDYPPLKKGKLAKWLQAWEDSAPNGERPDEAGFSLFPNPTDLPEFVKVRKIISVLGFRDDGVNPVAALDIVYNAPIAGGNLQAKDASAKSAVNRLAGIAEFPEIFGTAGSFVDAIAPEFNKKIADIDAAVVDLRDGNKGWARFDDELSALTEKSAHAAEVPGTVLELWSTTISIERIGGIYKVTAAIGSGSTGTISGCADIGSGAMAECPMDLVGADPATVTINRETGRFTVTANMDGLNKLTAELKAAHTQIDGFDLDYSSLGGRSLELIFDPTIVNGLKYYTGSLKITAPGFSDISGSVNFSSYGSTMDAYKKKYGEL
jgi:hypothetical protein